MELPCVPQTKNVSNRDRTDIDCVRIRFDRDKEGKAWLVISNDFPWRESFEIHWNGLAPEVARPLEKSPPVVIDRPENPPGANAAQGSSRWRCDIEASSHAGWELKASEAMIVQWQHRAEPAAMSMLENQIATLSQALTQLTQFRPLENTPHHGSFETSIVDGGLPAGWLVSMIPSITWSISDRHARTGNQSMLFHAKNASAVGWIQSPTFPLPDDGRVAAEAWIHFDPAFARPKIVATTTLLKPDGSRQSWKQTYQRGEVVDKLAKWQRIDFPSLNSNSLGTLVDPACQVQLAIDIEGPTHLWIDDMAASKVFLDEEERRQLRSQLFVARRELSQNRPMMAWQLMQSDISRFVLENAPTASVDAKESDQVINAMPSKPAVPNAIRQSDWLLFRRKLR